MDAAVYLYDASGKDREITLDEANLEEVREDQLLWINILKREENTVKKAFEKLDLENRGVRARFKVSEFEILGHWR